MSSSYFLFDFNKDTSVSTLTFNRPDMHNAFNEEMIGELIDLFQQLKQNNPTRLLIIKANGKSFCAGGDLNWMKKMAQLSEEENREDAFKLGQMLHELYTLPFTTCAVIEGPAYGGGVGLISCCDIALATARATFCLSEVKIGLIPGVISPYVVEAFGIRKARKYFLTAELISSQQALSDGLIHEIIDSEQMDQKINEITALILRGGPKAQKASKELIWDVAHQPISLDLVQKTALHIARIRASEEGQEGLNAFLNKRKPNWVKEVDNV